MIAVKCIVDRNEISSLEVWPEALPAVPRVGDRIESAKEWGNEKHRLTAAVTAVLWAEREGRWLVKIYLDKPAFGFRFHNQKEDFEHFYDRVRAQSEDDRIAAVLERDRLKHVKETV